MDRLAVHEDLPVPATLEAALDPQWLARALAHIGGGAAVAEVRTIEVIRTMATKVRFTLRFAGQDRVHALCLKSFLDIADPRLAGGATTVLEADFYSRLAPRLGVRVPRCLAAVVDREAPLGLIIMADLIAEGAQFCSALEAFSADKAAESLGQIAALHAGSGLLGELPWVTARVGQLARARYIPLPTLQDMLDGPRGEGLPGPVRDAARLVDGLRALAERDAARPQFLVHGDSHAGNIFRTAQGPGLIDWQLLQRGGWALDVAYHVNAVLPVELAEREERRLLAHYLDLARGAGLAVPDDEEAWAQYREAALYGYYLWSITRRVDPEVTVCFTQRLGQAVARHGSHRLLGIS